MFAGASHVRDTGQQVPLGHVTDRCVVSRRHPRQDCRWVALTRRTTATSCWCWWTRLYINDSSTRFSYSRLTRTAGVLWHYRWEIGEAKAVYGRVGLNLTESETLELLGNTSNHTMSCFFLTVYYISIAYSLTKLARIFYATTLWLKVEFASMQTRDIYALHRYANCATPKTKNTVQSNVITLKHVVSL